MRCSYIRRSLESQLQPVAASCSHCRGRCHLSSHSSMHRSRGTALLSSRCHRSTSRIAASTAAPTTRSSQSQPVEASAETAVAVIARASAPVRLACRLLELPPRHSQSMHVAHPLPTDCGTHTSPRHCPMHYEQSASNKRRCPFHCRITTSNRPFGRTPQLPPQLPPLDRACVCTSVRLACHLLGLPPRHAQSMHVEALSFVAVIALPIALQLRHC